MNSTCLCHQNDHPSIVLHILNCHQHHITCLILTFYLLSNHHNSKNCLNKCTFLYHDVKNHVFDLSNGFRLCKFIVRYLKVGITNLEMCCALNVVKKELLMVILDEFTLLAILLYYLNCILIVL